MASYMRGRGARNRYQFPLSESIRWHISTFSLSSIPQAQNDKSHSALLRHQRRAANPRIFWCISVILFTHERSGNFCVGEEKGIFNPLACAQSLPKIHQIRSAIRAAAEFSSVESDWPQKVASCIPLGGRLSGLLDRFVRRVCDSINMNVWIIHVQALGCCVAPIRPLPGLSQGAHYRNVHFSSCRCWFSLFRHYSLARRALYSNRPAQQRACERRAAVITKLWRQRRCRVVWK